MEIKMTNEVSRNNKITNEVSKKVMMILNKLDKHNFNQ